MYMGPNNLMTILIMKDAVLKVKLSVLPLRSLFTTLLWHLFTVHSYCLQLFLFIKNRYFILNTMCKKHLDREAALGTLSRKHQSVVKHVFTKLYTLPTMCSNS